MDNEYFHNEGPCIYYPSVVLHVNGTLGHNGTLSNLKKIRQ